MPSSQAWKKSPSLTSRDSAVNRWSSMLVPPCTGALNCTITAPAARSARDFSRIFAAQPTERSPTWSRNELNNYVWLKTKVGFLVSSQAKISRYYEVAPVFTGMRKAHKLVLSTGRHKNTRLVKGNGEQSRVDGVPLTALAARHHHCDGFQSCVAKLKNLFNIKVNFRIETYSG